MVSGHTTGLSVGTQPAPRRLVYRLSSPGKPSRKALLSVNMGNKTLGGVVKGKELQLLYMKERSGRYWILGPFVPLLSTAARERFTKLCFGCTSAEALLVLGQQPHDSPFVPTLMLLQDKQKGHVAPHSATWDIRSPSLETWTRSHRSQPGVNVQRWNMASPQWATVGRLNGI